MLLSNPTPKSPPVLGAFGLITVEQAVKELWRLLAKLKLQLPLKLMQSRNKRLSPLTTSATSTKRARGSLEPNRMSTMTSRTIDPKPRKKSRIHQHGSNGPQSLDRAALLRNRCTRSNRSNPLKRSNLPSLWKYFELRAGQLFDTTHRPLLQGRLCLRARETVSCLPLD